MRETRVRGTSGPLWATLALTAWAGAAAAGGWAALPDESELVVEAFKTGALERFAHDHRFVASSWTSAVEFDPAHPEATSLRVEVRADALHDKSPALDEEQRAEVDRIAHGPEVLDAARFPTISVEAKAAEARDGSLTMRGTVTLHGRERPVAFPMRVAVTGERAVAEGSFRVLQSDFGITPYRKFLGAVGVKDELLVSFRVAAVAR
jgi:polyisoprenoid-binding protein YceI